VLIAHDRQPEDADSGPADALFAPPGTVPVDWAWRWSGPLSQADDALLPTTDSPARPGQAAAARAATFVAVVAGGCALAGLELTLDSAGYRGTLAVDGNVVWHAGKLMRRGRTLHGP